MGKLLIFTNNENCDQTNFNVFEYLNISDIPAIPNRPVFLSSTGEVKDVEEAQIVILPDVNMIELSDQYPLPYQCLEDLMNKNEPLFIVWHQGTMGWNYRACDYYEREKSAVHQYLCEHPSLPASHTPSDFYCKELREIAEAIKAKNRDRYNSLLKEAKKKFSDPYLEAKLELLHTLLVPPEAKDENGTTAKDNFEKKINIQITELRKHAGSQYDDAWKKFLNNEPWKYHLDPFNDAYVGSTGLLTKLRDALLPEHEYEPR